MIRYVALLIPTLLLIVSCSGGSETKSTQVASPIEKTPVASDPDGLLDIETQQYILSILTDLDGAESAERDFTDWFKEITTRANTEISATERKAFAKTESDLFIKVLLGAVENRKKEIVSTDETRGQREKSEGGEKATQESKTALKAKGPPDHLTEDFRFTITQMVDGRSVEREVLVEIPFDFDPAKIYPLLFLFHGNGGDIESLSADNQGDTSADAICKGNCIGVIPQGVDRSWNLAAEGVNDELESNADDIGFAEAIIEGLSKYPQIDASKVFGIGYSNGAGMVQILAAESELFQGVAAFGTNLIQGREPKNKDHKVMILQFHGMQDAVIPYEGGDSIVGHTFIGAEESAQIWAEHNNCDPKGEVHIFPDGNKEIAYFNCPNGIKVLHHGIKNGNHDVAGPNKEYLNIAWEFFNTLLSPEDTSSSPQVLPKADQYMTAKEKLISIG